MSIVVKNYRIRGYYRVTKTTFKFTFEKEVRALNPEDAVENVKQFISSRNVNPRRITITEIYEIQDPEMLNDRVVKYFATEDLSL